MIILAVLLLAVCVYWIRWSARAQRMDRMTSQLPVPPTLPLIGNATIFIGDTQRAY